LKLELQWRENVMESLELRGPCLTLYSPVDNRDYN